MISASSSENRRRRRPRFTIRSLLILTLLIALGLGWHSSVQRAERTLALQTNRLRYAVEELNRVREELGFRDRATRGSAETLWDVQFDGARLRGISYSSSNNAFQRTSFKDCDPQNATLQAGGAAFQRARFDGANLADAKLTGGGSSFQRATFVGADLTGAVLEGGGSSFQLSSFEDATLVRTRLVGSFQLSNISGARFEGADLSALDSDSLASCYFDDPPSYDDQTHFPADFDPVARQWRRVSK
jgi:uncharacterized protein YjbI with pentapeptide repeats